jgi:septation ring formation regulator EzrA
MMPLENYHDASYYKLLSEIEKNTKDYMTTQFEHNKIFTEELKEHSTLLDTIAKQLDDVSKEVASLQSQFALTENLLGKISDAQATLVNQMAAKPESLEHSNDDDIKMIGFSSIDSLFSNIKLDEKGTEESQL